MKTASEQIGGQNNEAEIVESQEPTLLKTNRFQDQASQSLKIKIVLSTTTPHLPFPDGYFDVVTAFSVLTHIDKLEDAWLLELRRVTRPDGLLYLTIHNQATWNRVNDRPGSFENLLHANNVKGNLEVSQELFDNPMPEDRIVFRISPDDVYNCDVWMTNEYIHKKWGRYFEVLKIADNGHTSYQSPVIMRPRS